MIGQSMRTPRTPRRGARTVLFLCGLAAVAGPAPESADAATGPLQLGDREAEALQPVALPAVGHLHSAVQLQLGEAYRSLLAVARGPEAAPHARAEAFGQLGVLFTAAEFLRQAERCFRNAELLASTEFKWPYYLAHVLRRMGDLGGAAERFGRALELRPADLAATVWLSRMYLALGRPEAAEPVVAALLVRRPDAPALRAEAGHVALALDDQASAVEHLEAALALDPQAGGIHYPLAMAYRGLGEPDRAYRHLRRRREGGPGAAVRLPDPLMAALNGILRNPQYYRDLASHAASGGDWALAAAHLRTAAGAAPEVAMLRLSLGIVLERLGDIRAAENAFGEALRLDPRSYEAHYALGSLLARSGRDAEAIERFEDALAHNPSFAGAHLALADALRRSGQPGPSLASYRRVIELDPGNAAARFGEAMALVLLRSYAEARERLSRATAVHPGRTEFPHALARLLAAAPDDRVRDGAQALELMRALVVSEPTSAVAETMAMTLAELGLFAEAVEWQRAAMAIAARAARSDVARRMAVNLQLYLRRQPCRTPWRDGDPDLVPGPMPGPGLGPRK